MSENKNHRVEYYESAGFSVTKLARTSLTGKTGVDYELRGHTYNESPSREFVAYLSPTEARSLRDALIGLLGDDESEESFSARSFTTINL